MEALRSVQDGTRSTDERIVALRDQRFSHPVFACLDAEGRTGRVIRNPRPERGNVRDRHTVARRLSDRPSRVRRHDREGRKREKDESLE
jgi:hypothetical protein